jgi:hypothetical protein
LGFKKINHGKQLFYYIKPKQPIEFLSGTKDDIERLILPPPQDFESGKSAKDYAANILIPFGVNFLPIHSFGYIALVIEAEDSSRFSRIITWVHELGSRFDPIV